MDLDQPGPPNPLKLFYFIFWASRRLPTAFSRLPIADTITTSPPTTGGTPLFFLAINIHPYVVLNNILHDTHKFIPYITDSVFLEPETINLKLEKSRQEIQDATSDYVINITTPNTNILDTYDEKINYTKAFFQAHHYYHRPPSTPTSHISYPDAK